MDLILYVNYRAHYCPVGEIGLRSAAAPDIHSALNHAASVMDHPDNSSSLNDRQALCAHILVPWGDPGMDIAAVRNSRCISNSGREYVFA